MGAPLHHPQPSSAHLPEETRELPADALLVIVGGGQVAPPGKPQTLG